MNGDSYKKFLHDIQNCSDQKLKQLYNSVVDEMDKRSWNKKHASDVEKNSTNLENDWDGYFNYT